MPPCQPHRGPLTFCKPTFRHSHLARTLGRVHMAVLVRPDLTARCAVTPRPPRQPHCGPLTFCKPTFRRAHLARTFGRVHMAFLVRLDLSARCVVTSRPTANRTMAL